MQLVYCRSEQAAVPLGNLFTLPATHRGKNLRLNSCYHMNIKELNPPPAPHSVHLITSPLSLPLLSLYLFTSPLSTSPSLSTSQNSLLSPLLLSVFTSLSTCSSLFSLSLPLSQFNFKIQMNFIGMTYIDTYYQSLNTTNME